MPTNLPNPYDREATGQGWYFTNDEGYEFGPYRTQHAALRAALKYAAYGPTIWQRLKVALSGR